MLDQEKIFNTYKVKQHLRIQDFPGTLEKIYDDYESRFHR